MSLVTDAMKTVHQRAPGLCIGCDAPLPPRKPGAPGRPRTVVCGDPACTRLYGTLFKSEWRAIKRELRAAARLIDSAICEWPEVSP